MDLMTFATVIVVILTSLLLYSIAAKVHRRSKGHRFDGIKVVADPKDAKFE
jgi:hypothetical protein